ncbi:hypothetical protein AB0442_36325 [Kitasatospora sp. NPDC085895]|uniref:hypothetical protein n=1 Tax=Kitasatospora sp. NPDC085895 TaxID=3155057 RepID=UPI00344F415A
MVEPSSLLFDERIGRWARGAPGRAVRAQLRRYLLAHAGGYVDVDAAALVTVEHLGPGPNGAAPRI